MPGRFELTGGGESTSIPLQVATNRKQSCKKPRLSGLGTKGVGCTLYTIRTFVSIDLNLLDQGVSEFRVSAPGRVAPSLREFVRRRTRNCQRADVVPSSPVTSCSRFARDGLFTFQAFFNAKNARLEISFLQQAVFVAVDQPIHPALQLLDGLLQLRNVEGFPPPVFQDDASIPGEDGPCPAVTHGHPSKRRLRYASR